MFKFPVASLIAFFLGVLFFLLRRWNHFFLRPHIKFSNLETLKSQKPSLKQTWSSLPQLLLVTTLIAFLLAFLDPHYYLRKKEAEKEPTIKRVNIPSEGIAIYFVLDRSGSMSEKVSVLTEEGKRVTMTKMDLLKKVTRQFIEGKNSQLQGRLTDMLGLVAFARGAQVLAPLTLDHEAILKELDKLSYTIERQEEGTAIGYAIYKTANLIAATKHYAQDLTGEEKPAYEIKSTVMILVTDGFQSLNPLDQGKQLRSIELASAADYAKANNIRLYIINVEPRMLAKEFAPYLNVQKQIAELTGGKFYLVDRSLNLNKIYKEIDQLEKSQLPMETEFVTPPKRFLPHLYRRISFYPYLIGFGMLTLFVACLFETLFMKRVP